MGNSIEADNSTETQATSGQAGLPRDTGGAMAKAVIERYAAMKGDRQQWDILWDESARYIMQRKGNILTKISPGQKQTDQIYDTTAKEACGVAAAGIMTHIMPAGEKWFRLAPKVRNGQEPSAAVKEWLDNLSDICTDLIYSSNFYLAGHEDLIDLAAFGTGCYLLMEGKRAVLNFVNVPVGTYCIEEDNEGVVDVVAREWQWNARQAAQEFGVDALGPLVRAALDSQQADAGTKKFTFVNLIEPRKDVAYKGGPVAAELRPVRSVYVCKEDNNVLREDGYYEMPAICSRMERSNNEVYGRCPGMDVMAEIKMLNGMERDLLRAIELRVRPPWLVPNEADTDVVDNQPDGVTYWDATSPANKPEQLQFKNDISMGEQKLEQKRDRVRDAFWNRMFQLLTQADELRREKTAYEVESMKAEQFVLFSPIFARYVHEKLNPMIARVVGIAMRRGLAGQPPLEVQRGLEYEITYTSKIALAIKGQQNQAVATAMTLIAQGAAIDPSVTQLLKLPEAFRLVFRNIGLPNDIIMPETEFAAAQKAQKAQAMAAQAAQTGQVATKAVQQLGPLAQTEAARKIISASGTTTGKPGMAA